jgi:hypothetical protein
VRSDVSLSVGVIVGVGLGEVVDRTLVSGAGPKLRSDGQEPLYWCRDLWLTLI